MIVHLSPTGYTLVTQPDHARLAGDVLALWRADGLPTHPRRAELLLAAREHDNGWREADAAPRFDPATAGPLDFRRYPREERFALWHRALDRLAPQPYAAALVAHHALAVHRDHSGDSWDDFRSAIEARREQLRLAAAVELEVLLADYRFLELGDAVSLAACGALVGTRCRGYAIGSSPGAVTLEPFPLAGRTTFHIYLRIIEAKRYLDAVDLATSLAAARWQRHPVRLEPRTP